jgi:pyruvate dehydrogenase E1 component beta subunit
VVRQGKDVTLVSFGKMMKVAFETAKEMEKKGVAAEVIDLMSVRPIDYATIVESVKKTNRLVIVEEAWPLASISTEITYHVQKHAFDYLDAPIHRITSMDVPLPYAPTLIEAILPNVKRTVQAIDAVMYK